MREEQIRQLVAAVATQLLREGRGGGAVPVEVSARHVHLSQADVEALFGPGHTLTPERGLSQPGQFLAGERVSVVTDEGTLRNVAVLGPARKHTQVELSLSDTRALGLSAPVRRSGDTALCPGVCLLAGDKMLAAREAVIVAQSHIHMTPADARAYGVRDGQRVRVSMNTARPITLGDVVVRVSDMFSLSMHIDLDEANACALQSGETGHILPAGDGAGCPVIPARPSPAPEITGLLTAKEARRLAQSCGGSLRLARGAILTPLARDVLREKKISVLAPKED